MSAHDNGKITTELQTVESQLRGMRYSQKNKVNKENKSKMNKG